MSSEAITEVAAARLLGAGLPESLARLLAERVAGLLDQLRQQADALPADAEPATMFAARRREQT